MSILLRNVKLLYDQELYSNVISICDMIITLTEQKQNYLPNYAKLHILIYYADSLYYLRHYNKAENYYRLALHIIMRKSSSSSSSTSSSSPSSQSKYKLHDDFLSETNIKYKIHLCYIELKQLKKAISILETIQVRKRSSKIQMALGDLYKSNGMDKMAIACYKEVLNECPLALDAIENLIKFGVDVGESGSNIIEIESNLIKFLSEFPWLMSWIQAQTQIYKKEFSNAIVTYKSMDTHGLLKDNCSLLVNMGYCYHYKGEEKKAILLLQKALRLDYHLITGKDLLSTLLASSDIPEDHQALATLARHNESMPWSDQQWVIAGNLMYIKKKYENALKLAQQALDINGRNVEAILLKANTLIKLKQYPEAATAAHEATKLCSYRYEAYMCLIDSYMARNQLRDCELVIATAYKELKYNAQAHCLHAKFMLKDPAPYMLMIEQVLKKGIAKDRNGNTNALFMLVEVFQKRGYYTQAKNVLTNALETQQTPTSKIHEYLGDCYAHLNKYNDAIEHFTIALKLDPNNHKANEGLNYANRNLTAPKTLYDKRGGANNTAAERGGGGDAYEEEHHDSDGDLWPHIEIEHND